MNNKPQEGSGSAENKGQPRSEQQQPMQHVSEQDKSAIEKEIGTGAGSVVGLHDLGAASGRDDASGGSGDEMENTATGTPTDRF